VPDVQYPDDSISNPSTIRIEDLLARDDDAVSSPAPVPAREGLPRTFRMRADKHYVEMLDAPPVTAEPPGAVVREPRKPAVAGEAQQPAAAGEAQQPAAAGEAQQPAAAAPEAMLAQQAGKDLAQTLATLRSCTNLLSDRGPVLASTVAANLIRAEAWRGTCQLHTGRFLRGEIVPAPKLVRVRAVFDEVLTSIEPERRLRGVVLSVRLELGDATVVADESLLVNAVSGLLMATLALVEEHSSATVTVAAESARGTVVMAIAQDHAGAPPNWETNSVAIAGAARIVAMCGGKTVIAPTATGTQIRATLPIPR
jgi:hypothetical protein